MQILISGQVLAALGSGETLSNTELGKVVLIHMGEHLLKVSKKFQSEQADNIVLGWYQF